MQRSTLGLSAATLVSLVLSACGGGGGGNSPPPSPANSVPIANAGVNQTVSGGVLVTLNGTASSDPDGSIASYAWTQTGGTPAVTLSSGAASQPTFTAPVVVNASALTFSLVVTDNRGAASAASSVTVTVNPGVANGNVTGRVRFTRIPATANGLNYATPQLQPARAVQVRVLNANTQAVLATTSTDDLGVYAANIAPNTNVTVVVDAQMLRTAAQPLPRWDFRAQDADAANPTPYTYTDGQVFSSSGGTAHDIDIPSGFNATGGVIGTRASAPFAILDTVYQGVQLVLSVAPTTNFPALVLDWATDNPGGETFFDANGGSQHIVLSADPSEDTDEFDQHVIAHEFGHYIEFNFSRADNIGGSHGLGDKLDIRVAFGEGFGYAFGAIVLNDPVSRDTYTSTQNFVGCAPAGGVFLCTSQFNVDTNPQTSPVGTDNYGCWCSESSVWAILWDIYDSGIEANDSVALGFQPMWDVLTGAQRTTRAFTSIFSFASALKTAQAGSATAIDTLLAAQNITAVADIYGTGETHAPTQGTNGVPSAAALPVYTNITVGGGPVQVPTVNDGGHYNALGNRRYLKFTLAATQTITISLSSSNPDVNNDPDFKVWRNGTRVLTFAAANGDGEDPPANSHPELATITNAAAGDYLLDVYDCANGCDTVQGTAGDYNLTVTVQ